MPLMTACGGAPSAPSFSVSSLSGSSDTYDSKWGVSSSKRVITSGPIPKGGGHYKLGRAYQVGGRWYVPRHEPSYDRTGVGSWYGDDFHGRKTANGEIFDMNALTAAHPTLPMPSYAYVTNLRNGRTLLVRINDRGPYVANREIDLSRASARALGYANGGLGQVRVRWAGHAPLSGDDSREQAFLRNQPWNGGNGEASAVARFDRPAQPWGEPRPSPQRYARDTHTRSDAQYDRDDDRGQYDRKAYDAPARRPVDPRDRDSYDPAYARDRRAEQMDMRWNRDAYASPPPRAMASEAYGEPVPAPPAYEEPAPAPAADVGAMWSPFDHRETIRRR